MPNWATYFLVGMGALLILAGSIWLLKDRFDAAGEVATTAITVEKIQDKENEVYLHPLGAPDMLHELQSHGKF